MADAKLVNYALRTDGVEVITRILADGNNPNWIAAAYRLIAKKLEKKARSSGRIVDELGIYPSDVHNAFIREQGDRDMALIQNLRDGADWIELTYKLVDPKGASEKVWNLPK
jgi:hypothetical protein